MVEYWEMFTEHQSCSVFDSCTYAFQICSLWIYIHIQPWNFLFSYAGAVIVQQLEFICFVLLNMEPSWFKSYTECPSEECWTSLCNLSPAV